nr:VOC family protein [Candidatus Sigynarchaeota archaeon]
MIGKKNVLGSNQVTQIGIVVKDIEKSSAAFAAFFGVGKPSVSITGPASETHAEFKGKPTEAKAKLTFFRFKNIVIELIEPVGSPSTWQEFLDSHGEGVHHIAFNVHDNKSKIIELEEKSVKLVQKGDYPGGMYAYLDTTDSLKVILELLGR